MIFCPFTLSSWYAAGKHLQHVAACFGEATWEELAQPGWFNRRRKLWTLPHQLRLLAEVPA